MKSLAGSVDNRLSLAENRLSWIGKYVKAWVQMSVTAIHDWGKHVPRVANTAPRPDNTVQQNRSC
jgi:hypothetical protein